MADGGLFGGVGGGLTIAAGTETLTGANTYTGATTIAAGATLQLGNGGTTGSVAGNVVDNGTLRGFGSAGATQINGGGTFTPGNGTPGTSLTINGSLALASGALYMIALNPTTATFATVNGGATLGGTVQANFISGAYVTKQKQYTILTATGGLGGTTFGSLVNVNLPSGASDSLSYDADHAYLNLTVQFPTYTGLNQNSAERRQHADQLLQHDRQHSGAVLRLEREWLDADRRRGCHRRAARRVRSDEPVPRPDARSVRRWAQRHRLALGRRRGTRFCAAAASRRPCSAQYPARFCLGRWVGEGAARGVRAALERMGRKLRRLQQDQR